MKGSETRMTAFMEGADKRYIIPVYQRKYDWKLENCRQLYEDLKKVVRTGRSSHFFGSIVSAVEPNGSKIEYHIIDGQQRLTTVSLLLLAICNLVSAGKLTPGEARLDEQIRHRFLTDPWAGEDDRIKLRPVKSDREALARLYGPEEDYDRSSNLTLNYLFFREVLQKEEVPLDELYAAIGKLEIISITLDSGDNAQLIFESLNSTGLALSEGDKIRNYILMGLPPKVQSEYYDKYWEKIERLTRNQLSAFIRDYLSIKQQVTPNVNAVYPAFKKYAEGVQLSVEALLEELLKYARLFEKLLTCKSGLGDKRLDDCLYRMARLEITVTRPFLLEVLRLNQDGYQGRTLSAAEVRNVFELTENYLFRRHVCDVPTNALNKIFLTLNREILRYDNTAGGYVDKCAYALRAKRESGRFPDDREFADALSARQVYQMRGRYKAYLFERFENHGTVETKDVYTHLDNGEYSIEHIMPQHLTPVWAEELGPNAQEIHETWLHRLANLTLTGYNPDLSNKSFREKRDAEKGGYRSSGLRMNQKIAQKDAWGLAELEKRSREMVQQAFQIWPCPETDFKPAEQAFDSCTLDDEDVELTGREIVRYSLMNQEQPVTSWTDMVEHVVKFLHQRDNSVLTALVYDSQSADLSGYVSGSENGLRSAMKIDDHIYLEKNTSTAMKLSILRRLFALYHVDAMELVFYLRDADGEKAAESSRFALRRRYWEYAVPEIRKQHLHRGTYGNVSPTASNTLSGFFGISGFSIQCIANFDRARVDFYLGSNDVEKNKAAFDLLHSHREEIESELGVGLNWERADQYKASWLSYAMDGVSIGNEADWAAMAKFHAEWSDAICNAVLPYLQNGSELDQRLSEVAGVLREWVVQRADVKAELARCNRTLTRFTTEQMSAIFPDLPGALSGWGTENHYFYEIVNRAGDKVHIQLALSAQNGTEDFLALCDRISTLPFIRPRKDDWKWWTIFRTDNVDIGDLAKKDTVFAQLDQCMTQVKAFEEQLKQALTG